MLVIKPSVKVLRRGYVLEAYDLWLKSRAAVVKRDKDSLTVGNEIIPNSEESAYIDRIMKMGLQYTNFPEFTFEIQGSTIFRDILFTLNECAQWATSLRFVNSTYEGFNENNYPVSEEYAGIPEWDTQFRKYMDKIKETMVTDENRVEMPYSMSSKFWFQMNWKTLVTFLSMLKIKMPFFYNVYGTLFEEALKECDINIKEYYVPFIDSSIDKYFIHSTDEFHEKFDVIDETVHLNKTMGLLLFSQFIRQKDSTIKGLYNMVTHTDPEEFKHKVFYASTPINVRFISDEARFKRTIVNRNCWFSQASGYGLNSWSNILDLVIKGMPIEEFRNWLPCKFCEDGSISCKYYDDVKFRMEGVEKRNLPCAIFLKDKEIAKKRNEYDKTELSNKYVELLEVL